jgi:hypothetical protein
MSEPLPRVDVRSPTGPAQRHGDELVRWARQQLQIAHEIVDNPGGGLLFATQTMGQVRASLLEESGERFEPAARLLKRAEDRSIRREFDAARSLLDEALAKL